MNEYVIRLVEYKKGKPATSSCTWVESKKLVDVIKKATFMEKKAELEKNDTNYAEATIFRKELI